MPTTTTAATEAAALTTQLRADGFEPGTPAGLSDDTELIDRAIPTTMQCPVCSRVGMDYKPFHRERNYCALAVCPCCGAAEVY